MSETPEVRNLEYDVTTIEPPLSTPLSALRLNMKWSKDEDAFVEAPWRPEQTGQTFFELEIGGYRLLQNARLSLKNSDRWSWLELETTRSTQLS